MNGDRHLLWKQFIRDTLGCGCPDEVFEKIDITPLATDQSTGSPVLRINVGDRLLIYIAEDIDEAQVAEVLRAGIAERDAGGFNRFRLVVGCYDTLPEPTYGSSLMAALSPGDEKVHLHLIPVSEIPQLQRQFKQA